MAVMPEFAATWPNDGHLLANVQLRLGEQSFVRKGVQKSYASDIRLIATAHFISNVKRRAALHIVCIFDYHI